MLERRNDTSSPPHRPGPPPCAAPQSWGTSWEDASHRAVAELTSGRPAPTPALELSAPPVERDPHEGTSSGDTAVTSRWGNGVPEPLAGQWPGDTCLRLLPGDPLSHDAAC